MIYLIDDTNIESVNGQFILSKEFEHVLYRIETLECLDELRVVLNTADCIMIHRTFANSTIYKEQIAELTGDGVTIPLVIFSAGDSEHAVFDEKFPYVIEGIKKSVFYARLYDFLKTFIDNHDIDLRLIAYGKDYVKIKARNIVKSILHLIAGKEGNITMSELAKLASNPSFKELINMSNPALGLSYDNLLEDLEDNPISIIDFKNRINNILISFYQYGKNIYTWK